MLDPRAPEHEIAAVARHYAGNVRAFLHGQGKCLPADLMAQQLDNIAHRHMARPVAHGVSLSGRVARMVEPNWWTRNLRRSLLREAEQQAHAAGTVRRSRDVYLSEETMRALMQRHRVNRHTLEGMEVVNETGQALNLADVADGSVSNPKLRRSELMTRCRGFEEMAEFMDHAAVFLTITCPSRFHRFAASGKDNPAWTDETPRQAQKYLCGVWAKIRAEWKRQGFTPYGFRVAEPHHDGCPHWHILLFMPREHVGWFVPRRLVADRTDHGAGVVGIAGMYALEDSPGERGAIKHRFTCVEVDGSKGSATGYIAKYIAKNIDGLKEDGEGMGLDFASGKPGQDAARRVRGWASVHGIRQFQQIGGPSVTVWRQLRKLGKDLEQPLQLHLFEGPRSAANEALWFIFWQLQGGAAVPRSRLTLKPRYEDFTGGRYGDTVRRVTGVRGLDLDAGEVHELTTRLHEWTVQRAGQAIADAGDKAHKRVLRAFGTAWQYAAGESVPPSGGAAAAPWTGVNNCTDDGPDADDAALRADLLRGVGGFKGNPSCELSSWRPSGPPSGCQRE